MSAEFEVVVEAEHLCLNLIPARYQKRHKIILSLLGQRYTAKEIAAYLNEQGYATPRGRRYYAKLVGATISKLRRRIVRRQKGSHSVSKISFWLKDR